jgi:hypothetical protein
MKTFFKKSFCFTLIGFALTGIVHAQNANLVKLTPALPSQSGMSKFGDIPVDLHTGIAAVNVPLTSINVSGFTIPIGLSYHAGGIKTEEVASNVGLGWGLSAGGQINKLVVKYPDQGMTTIGAIADSVPMIEDGFGNRLTRNPANARNWKYMNDEPDLYKVNGPDINCRFSNLTVNSPKDKIKVVRLADESYLLTNTRGVKYYFGAKINESSYKKAQEDSTVYYLTQIELINGRKIYFEYETVAIEKAQSSGREFHYLPSSKDVQPLIDDGLSANNADKKDVVFRISNIVYPGGKLQFLYENVRKDLSGASMLTAIRQFDDAGNGFMRKTKDIRFYQSYFECNAFEVRSNPAVKAKYKALFYRLRLDSVALTASAHPETYSFYYNNTEMPEQGSLSQDHWGYFNGSPNQSLVAPYKMLLDSGTYWAETSFSSYSDRRSSDSLAQAGILKKVVYPGGGSTSFDYELNTTSNQFPGYVSYPNTVDQHLAFRRKTHPLPSAFSGQDDDLFAGTNFVVNSQTAVNGIKGEEVYFNFRKAALGNTSVFIQVKIIPLAAGTTSTQFITLDTVLSIPSGQINHTAFFSRFLPNGIYRVLAGKVIREIPGTGIYGDVLTPVQMSFSSGPGEINKGITTGSLNQYVAGGLRIKKMATFDGRDHSRDIVQSYKYNRFDDATVSSGSLGALPEYKQEQALLSVPVSTYQATVGTTIHDYLFAESYWAVQVTSDTVTSYAYSLSWHFENRKIESAIYATAFTYGNENFNVKSALSNMTALKPVESYIGYSNVTVEYGENASGGKKEFTYNNTGNDWQRGLLVKEKIFKKNNGNYLPVRETTSNYHIDNNWFFLQSMATKEYAAADTLKTLTAKSEYSYAVPFLNVPSRTAVFNAVGDSTITERKLVADFSNITQTNNLSAGIKQLYDKNILSVPIEETIYHKDSNARKRLVSTFTEYKNGSPYPETIYTSEVVDVNTPFSAALVSSGGVVKSSIYKPAVNFVKYDSEGNLQEQQKQDGVANSFIWGYDKRYLIAEVINANSGQVYHNSFEDTEGNLDGDAKAGLKSHAGNYTINFSPVGSETLKISYWYWSNNKWNFQSGTYTQGMVLSGDKIDEIRILPESAQMITYTYKPGIGMLTKCDAKHLYSYYEYNAEGKLIAIRNDHKDLVQTIQYQPKVVTSN